MAEPIIVPGIPKRGKHLAPISATGASFGIHEWSGSGPGYIHVHHADDEAWHVLEGTLTFRFPDRQVEAPAGTTVFVPAGVPHDYSETGGPARYLIVLTPRLRDLIAELHTAPLAQHAAIHRKYESEIVG
jgi:mannose-6-phosphate isomerase-like protein (cupin superfamily)